MNGSFDKLGEMRQIKQQLHVRELQMSGQWKRQRTSVYRMQQPDEESLEQLKMTLGACRAWIKEKAKPKKIEVMAEAETESDSVYTEGNEVESERVRQVENASEAERVRQVENASEAERMWQVENASEAEGIRQAKNTNIVSEPGKLQSAEELRRAVLWAEILGEPVAKRRRANQSKRKSR